MSDIRRFSLYTSNGETVIKPDNDGDWVLYADHAIALEAVKHDLKTELTDMTASRDGYRGDLEAVKATEKALEDNACPVCGNEERGQGGYLSCQCPAPTRHALVPSAALEANQQDGDDRYYDRRVAFAVRFLREYADGDQGKILGGYDFAPAVGKLAAMLQHAPLPTEANQGANGNSPEEYGKIIADQQQVIETLRAALEAERQADLAEERYEAMMASPDYDDDAVVDDMGEFVLELRAIAKHLRIAALTPPTQDEA